MDHAAVVVVSSNSCWNLVNFRGGLLSSLSDAGYHLVAFAPLDEHADELRRRGIDVWPVPLTRSGMNPVADARLLLSYLRGMRAFRPAAYCSFTIKPNVYGSIAARLTRVPAINNVTGLGTMFLSRSLTWRFASRLYRTAFKRSLVVFFHNREDRQIFVNDEIIRPEQGRVIPGSGVDLEHFKPAARDADGAPRFLFIGRAIRDKGIVEFVEAAKQLRGNMPRARFQVLGNPDSENPTSIAEAEFQSWINGGLIEHLGEHSDVRPFIASATAVVLPSYREGMSRALLEGAAMGKPLIGSDVPGSRELIEDGVTGVLCKARDIPSLAAAMQRIGAMPRGILREMGLAARAKVEREFGENIVIEAYLKALAQAVHRR